jgi:hypothetical protein
LEVRRAIALLKSSAMVMGNRDKAFDLLTKQAVQHLESARAGLGVGPAPQEPAGLEPSIVEWIFGAADAGLATADAMEDSATNPTKAEVLAGALLSIREWASRLLTASAPRDPLPPGGGIATPGGMR